MASKVTYVRKARKDGNICGHCKKPIKRGDPYKHWAFRYGGRHYRCDKPECSPKAWELESNSKRAALMQARHELAEYQANPESVSRLEEAISLVNDVIGELDYSLSGWEGTGLAESSMAQDFQSSKEELERWVSNAESFVSTFEEPEEGSLDTDGVYELEVFEEDIPDLSF